MNRIYYWSSNFDEIEALIDELSKSDKFLIPVFLLRSQLIEYALKYLLLHAPYKPKQGLGKKPTEEMMMGEVIVKLRECNDVHFASVIDAALDFKELRNEVTHNLMNSPKSISEVERLIEEKLEIAEKIEKQINYYAQYVEDVLGVNFEAI